MRYVTYEAENGSERIGIGANEIEKQQLLDTFPILIMHTEGEDMHIDLTGDIKKDHTIFINGKEEDTCGICVNRLKKISGGCKTCVFQSPQIDDSAEGREKITHSLLSYLSENAKQYKVAHTKTRELKVGEKVEYYDLDLSEENIERNIEMLQERAMQAKETKQYKKENCPSCVFYNAEAKRCLQTSPKYCKHVPEYKTEEDIKQTALGSIADLDRYLFLTTLCGRKVRYQNKRYRISCLWDEKNTEYLLIQDYAPWEEKIVPFSQISSDFETFTDTLNSPEKIKKYMENVSEETKEECGAILKLLRWNWDKVQRIERWQRQHMFYATFDEHYNRVDIEIHQSSKTFPYHYETVKDFCEKTATITC